MLYDITTIIRKDLKEFFVQRGSIRSGITNVLIILAITGVLFPLQTGREWLTNPIGLISVAWFPLLLSMGLTADAFAGERERHTLETLLASRLSDRAILLGKMLASVLYGFSIALAGMLLGAVTVNVRFPGAGFYPLVNFAAAVIFCLLGTLLITGIGVMVSMRASNVRQAYQKMSLGFLLIWLPLMVVPQLMPREWAITIAASLEKVDIQQLVLNVGVALFAIDVALIRIALSRFQRAKMILD